MDSYRFLDQLSEANPGEVGERVDSLDDLTAARGRGRARRVLLHVLGRAPGLGIDVPPVSVTDYEAQDLLADDRPENQVRERRRISLGFRRCADAASD